MEKTCGMRSYRETSKHQGEQNAAVHNAMMPLASTTVACHRGVFLVNYMYKCMCACLFPPSTRTLEQPMLHNIPELVETTSNGFYQKGCRSSLNSQHLLSPIILSSTSPCNECANTPKLTGECTNKHTRLCFLQLVYFFYSFNCPCTGIVSWCIYGI